MEGLPSCFAGVFRSFHLDLAGQGTAIFVYIRPDTTIRTFFVPALAPSLTGYVLISVAQSHEMARKTSVIVYRLLLNFVTSVEFSSWRCHLLRVAMHSEDEQTSSEVSQNFQFLPFFWIFFSPQTPMWSSKECRCWFYHKLLVYSRTALITVSRNHAIQPREPTKRTNFPLVSRLYSLSPRPQSSTNRALRTEHRDVTIFHTSSKHENGLRKVLTYEHRISKF